MLLIDFIFYYQAIVVQLHIMCKRNGCAIEYRRYINASAHKLVNKSLAVGSTRGVKATISYLIIK